MRKHVMRLTSVLAMAIFTAACEPWGPIGPMPAPPYVLELMNDTGAVMHLDGGYDVQPGGRIMITNRAGTQVRYFQAGRSYDISGLDLVRWRFSGRTPDYPDETTTLFVLGSDQKVYAAERGQSAAIDKLQIDWGELRRDQPPGFPIAAVEVKTGLPRQ